MKKIFTLIFALLLSVSIFAVKVTLKVDMTGQDVSQGVFVTGEINGWVFTAMTDEGKNMYSTVFNLNAGDSFIYYFLRTNSWDTYKDYRETIPAECANSNQKTGGWDGDRLIIVPATDVVVNHIFSSCLTTVLHELNAGFKFSVFPNPASEKVTLKLNGKSELLRIVVSDLNGKEIRSMNERSNPGSVELDLSGISKGVYFVKASNGNKTHIQKLIVQ